MKCGAKTRSGGTCHNPPVKGATRCRLHGGMSKRGRESATYKHGLYSKYAGDDLKTVLDELSEQSGDELLNPENEIRLMQALIISAKTLEDKITDLHRLDSISKIIERLVMAKQRSQAIMIEQKRFIPATDIEQFLSWMETLLIEKIGEDGYDIIDKLKTFKLSDHENH